VVIVVMGPTGAGKTTVGRALAAALGWTFVDADDYHTPASVAKMRAGTPLDDADRAPWLRAIHQRIAAAVDRRESLVVACSALRARYRDVLRGDLRTVRFLNLSADAETLARRAAGRVGHFAGPSLVRSQLADLEPPSDALTLDATRPVDEIVAAARYEFGV
jgi:gluconokinase